MSYRIDRIAGQVMPVNSFVVHGPDGLVVVDGMLTISDAALVREAIDDANVALAGVVITHPHPDHYAGLAHIVDDPELPIIATGEVAAVIQRDDETKDAIVGPMMGPEWPNRRLFPNHTVGDGDTVTLGGLTLRVRSLGPGESFADTIWELDDGTLFVGDVAYNEMHAYLADGQWSHWLDVDRPPRPRPALHSNPLRRPRTTRRQGPARSTAPLHRNVRRGRTPARRRSRRRRPPPSTQRVAPHRHQRGPAVPRRPQHRPVLAQLTTDS